MTTPELRRLILPHDPSIRGATQPTETPAPDNTASNQEPAAYPPAPMRSSAAVAVFPPENHGPGTWAQQDSTNLENYMDAVIHDGIIESPPPQTTKMATPFWAGTFGAKTGNFNFARGPREAGRAVPLPIKTKEFTMENGVQAL